MFIHCENYLVKIPYEWLLHAVSGFTELVDTTRRIQIHHPLHSSVRLHEEGTDTCSFVALEA